MQESRSEIQDTASPDTVQNTDIQVVIKPLDNESRGNFCCGVSRIDNFFKNNARKDHEAYKVRVFIAHLEGESAPIGFYSLTLTAILPSEISENAQKKFARVNAVPAIYLAMLGVSENYKKKGVGPALMQNAISRALLISDHAGAYAIVLDALNEQVAKYYAELGFEPFIEGDLRMFLELATVRGASTQAV